MLSVPNGSINVVPGRCQFSLDLRATTDAKRDSLANDVTAELARMESAQGGSPGSAIDLPVGKLPEASIDYVRAKRELKLQETLPQAMLFLRGGNSGISHNPLETITNDDAELCVQAFQHLLEQLASELNPSST